MNATLSFPNSILIWICIREEGCPRYFKMIRWPYLRKFIIVISIRCLVKRVRLSLILISVMWHGIIEKSGPWIITVGPFSLFWERSSGFFEVGPTTLKFSYKKLTNQDINFNAETPGASLSQDYRFGTFAKISLTATADLQDALAPTNDLFTYKLTPSATFPGLLDKMILVTSVGFSWFDTRKNFTTRGLEFQINPSVNVSYSLTKHWGVSASYSFTDKDSQDTENYKYSKHVVGLGANYSF